MAATRVDKAPVRGGTGTMDEEELYPGSSRSLDSLREMRLKALLGDMIDAEDGAKAAETLGVSYRTVSRAVESGRLTARMSAALERHLLLGGGSAAAQQRVRGDALVERLDALERELRGGLEAVVGEVKALREEHARSMRHVERRLVRLEAGGHGSETPSPTGAEGESGPKRRYVRPRTYPQLVTPEAEPDEDLVYGDATPVIVEWRRVRAEFLKTLKTGTTLDRTEVQEPMLELELAIVEEHGLTLPPASFPWDEFDRRDKVWERTQDLKRVRAERTRALLRRWLRRVLTLRLWRN